MVPSYDSDIRAGPRFHLLHGKNEETDIPMVAASDPSGELIS